MSNSLYLDEMPSYSASHPDPSCFYMAPCLCFGRLRVNLKRLGSGSLPFNSGSLIMQGDRHMSNMIRERLHGTHKALDLVGDMLESVNKCMLHQGSR